MPNRKPILVTLLLDETGSMSARRDETIASVNAYLADRVQEWKDSGQVYLVTLAKFSSAIPGMVDTVHKAVPVSSVKALDYGSYHPGGYTPLYDAVGKTIADVENVLSESPGGEAVLFIIVTDGEENASREFSREAVASLVEAKTAKGWEFVFLGVAMDAWASASQIGITAAGTQGFRDMGVALRTLSEATAAYAQSATTGGSGDFWGQSDVDEDK